MARYECTVCGYVYDEDQEGLTWDAFPATGPARLAVLTRRSSTASTARSAADQPERLPRHAGIGCRHSPVARNTAIEPTLEFIHSLAQDGLEKVGHHGPMGAMGVPRPTLPQWDDIQILPAQLATKPLAEDVDGRHRTGDRPQCPEAPAAGDPDLRLRHELRGLVGGGQDRPGQRCRDGRNGHRLRRRWDAAGRERRQLPLLLRVGVGQVRLHRRPAPKIQAFHFKAGQAAKTGTGRPSSRQQGQGEDRRDSQAAGGPTGHLAAVIHRSDHPGRLPPVR